MAQYAARPGGFASQRLGLLPAEMWDQGFQYLDSSSLARVRLVNKQFKALATRHFFRQAVLCYRPTWKLVRFMASVRSDKDNGSAVRDLALYIPIESHFVECHSYDFRRSLQAMPNLVKLSLTLSHPYNSTEKTSSQLLLADLLSSVYFPQMEELEIRGFLSHVLEGFVSRVASTLKKLRLDVEAPPGFTSTTTGPPFVVLREAAVPPASLGLLTRSGLPALNTFELFFDDMLSTENSLSVLAPNVGGNLERLQVHVVGLGECIFATISPHFTQLKVLVISCIPDLFAHPHESRRWGELIERSNVVYHCSLLTKLELLDWSMGYFGDWDRGWEYLLQITQHNPKLDQISFPEIGIWRRIRDAFWIPSCLNPKDPQRPGYRWLVDSIVQLEAGLVKYGDELDTKVLNPWKVIESLRQQEGPVSRSVVYDLLQLGWDLNLY